MRAKGGEGRRGLVRGMALLLSVICGACGGSSASTVNARAEEEGLPAPRFLSRVSVPTVQDAVPYLSFTPLLPKDLGDPKAVVMNDPDQVDRERVAIGMLYEDTELGTFWLKESPPAISQADIERLAKRCTESNDCAGETWSLLALEDGTEALLIDSPPTGLLSLRWIAVGLEFSLLGERDTFSQENAQAVAASLAR
jgi:hypothetical protein